MIAIFACCLLSCKAIYGPEHPSFGHLFQDPSEENGYVGTIGNEPPYNLEITELEKRCLSYGGLDSNSIHLIQGGWEVINSYQYKCKFAKNPPSHESIIVDTQAKAEVNIDPIVHNSNLIEVDKTKNSLVIKRTIDSAKKQCEELGFKPKTAQFGKCVLELTK